MTAADTVKGLIVIAIFLILGIAIIWNAAAKRRSGRGYEVGRAYGVFTRFSSGVASLMFALLLTYLLISDISNAHK